MSGALDVEQCGWAGCKQTNEFPHTSANFMGRNNGSNSSPPLVDGTHQAKEANPLFATVDEPFSVSQKIVNARTERDEFWQRHEQAQLDFMRGETEKLMGKMHKEMERLHMANRDLERRLFVESKLPSLNVGNAEELAKLKRELSAERQTSVDLRRELGLAVKRSARLAQMLEKTAHMHKEHTAKYEQKLADAHEQIRRLNGLLLAKSKSRSIGPTMSRFGIPARRSQSGESRCRIDGCSRSEAASTSSTSKGCDDRGRELHLMGKNAQEKIQKGGEERQDH